MNERRLRVYRLAEAAIARGSDPARHKCFVSYHVDDADEVADFLDAFGEVFIPRVIGVTEDDDFVDSEDTDYVMDRIREKYLTDTTVTIVLVGKCTRARRFVDWEVYSTLRNDANNKRSVLMAITLPSVAAAASRRLPDRVSDNVKGSNGDEGYARWWKYPSSGSSLKGFIQKALDSRSELVHLIDNSRPRKKYNSACS